MSTTLDVAPVLDDATLTSRLDASARLAQSYLDSAVKMEAEVSSFNDQQSDVLTSLAPYNVSTYSNFYNPDYGSRELNFEDFKRHIVKTFLSHVVSAVSAAYRVDFRFEEYEDVVSLFVKDGINMDVVQDNVRFYLGGKTFEEVNKAEVTQKMVEKVKLYWTNDLATTEVEKRTNMKVNDKTVTLAHFASIDDWSSKLSYAGEVNIYTLASFFDTVLNFPIDFSPSRVSVVYGETYTPPATMNSIVKSLRVYKNGNLRITFHNEEDANVFVDAIMKALDADK